MKIRQDTYSTAIVIAADDGAVAVDGAVIHLVARMAIIIGITIAIV